MGLDFSHCKARWSYGGFYEFRKRLASGIGIDLEKMAGFVEGGKLGKAWPSHPLTRFINHSDCDGELDYEEMTAIIPALTEAIKDWSEDDYDHMQAKELIRGMKHAIRDGVPLFFR